jgi:hypothetical protein
MSAQSPQHSLNRACKKKTVSIQHSYEFGNVLAFMGATSCLLGLQTLIPLSFGDRCGIVACSWNFCSGHLSWGALGVPCHGQSDVLSRLVSDLSRLFYYWSVSWILFLVCQVRQPYDPTRLVWLLPTSWVFFVVSCQRSMLPWRPNNLLSMCRS